MYYIVYQTTNKVNGKFYIGVHKTNKLNDGYMGSGKALKAAILKYGSNNFVRHILVFAESEERMYAIERQLVTEQLVNQSDNYNLTVGGVFGVNAIPGLNNKNKTAADISRRGKMGNAALVKKYGKSVLYDRIKRAKEIQLTRLIQNKNNGITNPGSWCGKRHTEETKIKMSNAKRNKRCGSENSQYGTCWITHSTLGNKKIHEADLPHYLNLGWVKGRKIKQ